MFGALLVISYYFLYRLRRHRLLVLVLAILFGGLFTFGLTQSDPNLSIGWRFILLLSGACLNLEGTVILLVISNRRNP